MSAPEAEPVSELLARVATAGGTVASADGVALTVRVPKGHEDLGRAIVSRKADVLVYLILAGRCPGEVVVIRSTDPAAVGGRWAGAKWIPPAQAANQPRPGE